MRFWSLEKSWKTLKSPTRRSCTLVQRLFYDKIRLIKLRRTKLADVDLFL